MSRVSEQQQQQRAEAERLQKKADQQARESARDGQAKSQFGNLVKNQQRTQGQEAQKQGALKDAQQKAAEEGKAQQGKAQESQGEALRNARLARGGALQQSKVMQQAESFHSMLDAKKGETEQLSQTLKKDADETKAANQEAVAERQTDFEHKAEEKKDIAHQNAKADAAKKGKANAAIDGDTKKGDDKKGDGRNEEAAVDGARRAGAAQQSESAQEVQGAAGAKELPPEVLEALVKQVHIGVNEKGEAMFRIELQDGVLQGASLQVTSKNGKVGLEISGLDDNARRLVQASVGSLQRKLESRGLALDSLTVS